MTQGLSSIDTIPIYQIGVPLTQTTWFGTPDPHQTKWTQRMRDLAEYWSQYSTCQRRKVGAVLYVPESFQVLTFGYNDTPAGETNCGDGGCTPCSDNPAESKSVIPSLNKVFQVNKRQSDVLECFCVHAEMNCLNFAARWGIKVQGARLVATTEPCRGCQKNLKQAGVIWLPS